MSTLALVLILTALAAWAIHRDIKRAVARRRFRKFAPRFKAAGVALAAMGAPMAQVARAAQQMEESMRRVKITLTADTSKFEAAIRKAQEEAR